MENQEQQHHRNRRPQLVDRPDHGDGQMLHGRVAEHPRGKDEGGLAQDEQVLLERQRLDVELLHEAASKDVRLEMRQQHKRQEQEAANEGAIEKDRYDGVVDDGLFLEDVVEAQKDG